MKKSLDDFSRPRRESAWPNKKKKKKAASIKLDKLQAASYSRIIKEN